MFSVFCGTLLRYLGGLGMSMVAIIGGIDISVGSTLGVAILISRTILAGYHPFLAVLVGVVVGLVIGAINGVLIAKARIVPIIATLGIVTYFGHRYLPSWAGSELPV